MSPKQRQTRNESSDAVRARTSASPSSEPVRPAPSEPPDRLARMGVLIVAIILVCVVVILADALFGAIANQGGNVPSAKAAQTLWISATRLPGISTAA